MQAAVRTPNNLLISPFSLITINGLFNSLSKQRSSSSTSCFLHILENTFIHRTRLSSVAIDLA